MLRLSACRLVATLLITAASSVESAKDFNGGVAARVVLTAVPPAST
jgi:hypothetical protein